MRIRRLHANSLVRTKIISTVKHRTMIETVGVGICWSRVQTARNILINLLSLSRKNKDHGFFQISCLLFSCPTESIPMKIPSYKGKLDQTFLLYAFREPVEP